MAFLVLQGRLETQGRPDRRDLRDQQDHQDHRDQPVGQVRKVPREK